MAEREAVAERRGPAAADGQPGDPSEMVDGALDLAAAIACAFDRMTGSGPSRQLNAQVAYRAWILDEPSAAIARHLGVERKTIDTRLCRLRSAVRGAQASLEAEAALRALGSRPPVPVAGPGRGSREGSAPKAGSRAGAGSRSRAGSAPGPEAARAVGSPPPGSAYPAAPGAESGAGSRPGSGGSPVAAASSANRAATSGLCSS